MDLNSSMRSGYHATVYEIRRDPELKNKDVIRDKNKKVFPFVGGSQYKGSWNNDKKEGFGIQVNQDGTKYEGEWHNNRYEGKGTLWIKKGKQYQRVYVGGWVNGTMEGQGVYYYENGEIYRGGWMNNKKHGEGRLDHSNGDSYIGEWADDLQEGFGAMNYSNGNIFEGLWSRGMKEGPGLYFYASTKKVYQGEWSEDQPRCGEFRHPNSEEELRFVRPLPKGVFHNDFKLPSVALADADKVLDMAVTDVRMGSLNNNKTLSRSATQPNELISKDALQAADTIFCEIAEASSLDGKHAHTISIYRMNEVMLQLGLNLTESDVREIVEQLEIKDTLEISFAEVVEIATFIHEQKIANDLPASLMY